MVALYNYIALALLLGYLVLSQLPAQTHLRRKYLIIVASVLTFISAVRYECASSDYQAYINSFYIISRRSFAEILQNREIGYQLIQKGLSFITNEPQSFFALSGFCIIASYAVFCWKYSENPILSFLLFFLLGAYFSSHNATRQYLAISVCLVAYSFAKRKSRV